MDQLQRGHTSQSFLSKVYELMFYANKRLGVFRPPEDLAPYLEEKREDQERAYVPPKVMLFYSTMTMELCEGVPVLTFVPKKTDPQQRMIYFHGGAYIDDPSPLHFHFIDALIRETPLSVHMPVYPKTPRYTALDVHSAMKQVLGTLPEADIIAGDSAGGGLSLALVSLENLKPRHLILISPWLDLSLSDPAVKELEAVDPLLNRTYLREVGKHYKGDLAWDDPLVSPLESEIEKEIEVTLFTGTHEIFLSDIRHFAERIRTSNPLNYIEVEGMNHDFPLFPMKEGVDALNTIVSIIASSGSQCEA